MVWKEEGASTGIQGNASDSEFSTFGDVSHFSYWNIDWALPLIQAKVVIVVVDLFGLPRAYISVVSYTPTVRIPPEAGRGSHGETGWSNTKQLTPESDQIAVMGNFTMDVIVDNVMVKGCSAKVITHTTNYIYAIQKSWQWDFRSSHFPGAFQYTQKPFIFALEPDNGT
jgi:hypothetical protein